MLSQSLLQVISNIGLDTLSHADTHKQTKYTHTHIHIYRDTFTPKIHTKQTQNTTQHNTHTHTLL